MGASTPVVTMNMQQGAFGPGGAAGQIPGSVTGEAALTGLDPNTQRLIRGVGTGQLDYASVVSRMTPAAKQNFTGALLAFNPNFNQAQYGTQAATQRAFTSGQYSQQLNSLNTAIEHMKTFNQMADALNNNNVQALNKLGNTVNTEFGSDAATNFNIAKQAFSGEVGKAFAGANVGEGDRKALADQITAASSPAQLRGAAKTAQSLLEGKRTALQQTYQSGMAGQPNFGQAPGGGGNQASGGHPFFSQFGGQAR